MAFEDELGFPDITATVEGRRTLFDVLARVTAAVKIPVTAGGGTKSMADIDAAFAAGEGISVGAGHPRAGTSNFPASGTAESGWVEKTHPRRFPLQRLSLSTI